MRWPKPDELRRWTAEDQTVLRKWRQAVFTFYGVVIGLLIFTATLGGPLEPTTPAAMSGHAPTADGNQGGALAVSSLQLKMGNLR
jgi:hypothetical protein